MKEPLDPRTEQYLQICLRLARQLQERGEWPWPDVARERDNNE